MVGKAISKAGYETGGLGVRLLLIIGFLILGLTGRDYYNDYRKRSEPVETWLIVNSVSIPDHLYGSDPDVIYDRLVVRDFTGKWFVLIYNVETPNIVDCDGSGSFQYRKSIIIPDKKMPMSRFVGKKCNLAPGCYRGEVRWEVFPDGYPVKRAKFKIDRFCVKDGEG